MKLTTNFLFIEYYSHTNAVMFKILNEFTTYKEDKVVLCKMSDGIEKALDLAIEKLTHAAEKFYGLPVNKNG